MVGGGLVGLIASIDVNKAWTVCPEISFANLTKIFACKPSFAYAAVAACRSRSTPLVHILARPAAIAIAYHIGITSGGIAMIFTACFCIILG